MIRYVHGSEDSLDLDVIYVFDSIPNYATCRKFCSEDKNENRNIIEINNGIVSNCFIGTIDEINNGLLDTYGLHKQDCPLLITQRVDRDILMKSIRCVRGILSILSRTQYRKDIKNALKSDWNERLRVFELIDLTEIDFNNLDKRMNGSDMLKVIAFQIGQTLGLYENKELYTKSEIATVYPFLRKFLYREELKTIDYYSLDAMKMLLANRLKLIKTEAIKGNNQNVCFIEENRTIDLKHEEEIYV